MLLLSEKSSQETYILTNLVSQTICSKTTCFQKFLTFSQSISDIKIHIHAQEEQQNFAMLSVFTYDVQFFHNKRFFGSHIFSITHYTPAIPSYHLPWQQLRLVELLFTKLENIFRKSNLFKHPPFALTLFICHLRNLQRVINQ